MEPAIKFLVGYMFQGYMFQADYTTFGNCLIECSSELPSPATVREAVLSANTRLPKTGKILILSLSRVNAESEGKDFAFVNKTGIEPVVAVPGVKLLENGK